MLCTVWVILEVPTNSSDSNKAVVDIRLLPGADGKHISNRRLDSAASLRL